MTDETSVFDDDPILGAFVAYYPSNRLRLLIIGAVVLAVVWFVVTVALWQVEEGLASIITVVVLAATTLLVGWFITHLWNREVVLYERGFSYREGSNTAFILYEGLRTIRQQGERLSYFGGLVRRTTFRCTMTTDQDEIITLTNLYSRIEDLTARLEVAITRTLHDQMRNRLAAGEAMPFTDDLELTMYGLRYGDEEIEWSAITRHSIENGELIIATQSTPDWFRERLTEIDNVRFLVDLLRAARAAPPSPKTDTTPTQHEGSA